MPIEDRTYSSQQLMFMRSILESLLTKDSLDLIMNFEVHNEEQWKYQPSPLYIKKKFPIIIMSYLIKALL